MCPPSSPANLSSMTGCVIAPGNLQLAASRTTSSVQKTRSGCRLFHLEHGQSWLSMSWSMRRNMTKAIPAVILGRLGSTALAGSRVGPRCSPMWSGRAARLDENLGPPRLVHAISPSAEDFYLHHGLPPAVRRRPLRGLVKMGRWVMMGRFWIDSVMIAARAAPACLRNRC